MTIPSVKPLLPKIARHPMWLGFAFTLAMLGWISWLAYSNVISPAPTEAEIAQQTIRFNESGYTAITDEIKQYQQPVTLPDFPRNPFQSIR